VKNLIVLGPLLLVAFFSAEGAETSRLSFPVAGGGSVRVEAWNVSESRVGETSRILGFRMKVSWTEPPKKGRPSRTSVLQGDQAVLWVKSKVSKNSKRPIANLVVYAEGNVVFEQGRDRIRSDRFLYDFSTGRGVAGKCRVETRLALTGDKKKHDFVMRAEELRLLFDPFDTEAPKKLVCRGISFTHCSFGEPHFDIHASEVSIATEKGQAVGEGWFEATGIKPRFFGVPFFYIPWVGWKLDWRPLVRVHPGTSSEFGAFLDTAVGMRFRKGGKPGRPGREVARVWLPVTYFERRGTGVGLNGTYRNRSGDEWMDIEGEFQEYYIRDRGDRRDEAVARGLYPLITQDRYRSYLWHRHRLPEGFRFDLELNAYSDKNFLLEFYEDEWKTQKPPESYALITRNEEFLGVAALAAFRLNPFREEVEYLPRVRIWLNPFDLLADWFDVSLRAEVSQARFRPANDAPVRVSRSAWRLDVEPEIGGSFLWGPVGFRPFLRPRITIFETSTLPDERAVSRTSWTAGLRALTWAWRVYDIAIPSLGIARLRHVATPQVTYIRTFGVSRPSSDLVPFDEIEDLQNEERVSFRLENRIEALFERHGKTSVSTVLRLDAQFDYFPRPDRDNGGDWFSPLKIDLRFDPASYVAFEFNGEIDLDSGRLTAWNGTLRLTAGPVNFSLTSANVSGSVHTVFASVGVRFSPRYSVKAYENHDLQRGDMIEAGISIQRTFHCWVLEVGAVYDRGEKNTTFILSFLPTIFARDKTSAAVRTNMAGF